MEDKDWDVLIKSLHNGKCTPFLGPGISSTDVHEFTELARIVGAVERYPLGKSCTDLPRLAQFIAIHHGDDSYPRNLVSDAIEEIAQPDFSQDDQPHGVLASFPISIYVTSTYDNFMYSALERKNKQPRIEIYRWKDQLQHIDSIFDSVDPHRGIDRDKPVVFHLLGHSKTVESLVVSEDDYIKHLSAMVRDAAEADMAVNKKQKLPLEVIKAFRFNTLLFVGYSVHDYCFRIIMHVLDPLLQHPQRERHKRIAVQLPEGDRDKHAYVKKLLGSWDLVVEWGTPFEFAKELKRRYEAAFPAR
jgi:hypothetical protein